MSSISYNYAFFHCKFKHIPVGLFCYVHVPWPVPKKTRTDLSTCRFLKVCSQVCSGMCMYQNRPKDLITCTYLNRPQSYLTLYSLNIVLARMLAYNDWYTPNVHPPYQPAHITIFKFDILLVNLFYFQKKSIRYCQNWEQWLSEVQVTPTHAVCQSSVKIHRAWKVKPKLIIIFDNFYVGVKLPKFSLQLAHPGFWKGLEIQQLLFISVSV